MAYLSEASEPRIGPVCEQRLQPLDGHRVDGMGVDVGGLLRVKQQRRPLVPSAAGYLDACSIESRLEWCWVGHQSISRWIASKGRSTVVAVLRRCAAPACTYPSIHPNRYDKLLDRTHRKRAPRPAPALPRAAGSGTTIQPPWPRLFLCAPRPGIKPWARAALCFGPAGQPPPLTRRRLLVPTPPRRRARSQQAAGSPLHARFL